MSDMKNRNSYNDLTHGAPPVAPNSPSKRRLSASPTAMSIISEAPEEYGEELKTSVGVFGAKEEGISAGKASSDSKPQSYFVKQWSYKSTMHAADANHRDPHEAHASNSPAKSHAPTPAKSSHDSGVQEANSHAKGHSNVAHAMGAREHDKTRAFQEQDSLAGTVSALVRYLAKAIDKFSGPIVDERERDSDVHAAALNAHNTTGSSAASSSNVSSRRGKETKDHDVEAMMKSSDQNDAAQDVIAESRPRNHHAGDSELTRNIHDVFLEHMKLRKGTNDPNANLDGRSEGDASTRPQRHNTSSPAQQHNNNSSSKTAAATTPVMTPSKMPNAQHIITNEEEALSANASPNASALMMGLSSQSKKRRSVRIDLSNMQSYDGYKQQSTDESTAGFPKSEHTQKQDRHARPPYTDERNLHSYTDTGGAAARHSGAPRDHDNRGGDGKRTGLHSLSGMPHVVHTLSPGARVSVRTPDSRISGTPVESSNKHGDATPAREESHRSLTATPARSLRKALGNASMHSLGDFDIGSDRLGSADHDARSRGRTPTPTSSGNKQASLSSSASKHSLGLGSRDFMDRNARARAYDVHDIVGGSKDIYDSGSRGRDAYDAEAREKESRHLQWLEARLEELEDDRCVGWCICV
jgi:hypothetical protein